MREALPVDIRRKIERYVDDLMKELDLPEAVVDEARSDFVEHLETEWRSQRTQGSSPEASLERACELFGDSRTIRRQLASLAPDHPPGRQPRQRRRSAIAAFGIQDLWRELWLAVRAIRRERGFAATVVVTIAVGIAATTTIFSVVDGILLRPLPYPESDRIVAVWPSYWFSSSSFRRLESEATSFSAVAGYSPRSARLRDRDGTRLIYGPRVSARFFDVLGPGTVLGGTFHRDANEPGREKVVVVTHGFYERELGGDPSAIGETIALDGAEHTLVGVLAPGFDLLQPDAQIVIPKRFDPSHVRYHSQEMKALARLKPGVTIDEAEAEIRTLAARWKEEFGLPDDFDADVAVVPLREYVVGSVRPVLLLLFGSVALLLLIACTNVANLLLARGLSRQREISLRLALGAKPARVVRQLLAESTVLAVVGGLAGFAITVLGVRLVLSLLPADTPRLSTVAVDARVAAFAAALALATGWLVTVAPARHAVSTRLRESLMTGARVFVGHHRLRRAIVAAQVGLVVMLLTAAGLLVKSAWQLRRVDPGIRAPGLVTFSASAESERLTSRDEAETFHRLVVERLEALPGVTKASTISQAPYTEDGGVASCFPADAPPAADESPALCRWRPVGADYFAVAGTDLLDGRAFGPDDVEGTEPVAILSLAAGRELFPNGALGERVVTSFERTVENEESVRGATVVGIVADVRFRGLAEQSPFLVYRPYAQVGAIQDRFGFYGREYVVRSQAGALSFAEAREAVRAVDPYALISGYQTMEAAITDSVSDRYAVLFLMSAFTAAAVLLGTIGVYGITAHGVRSRSRELSIRVALGASERDVLKEVILGSLKIAAVGAVVGLALALALARWTESFLYEVTGTDPWVAGGAIVLALSTSLAATWIPARRAATADPIEALAAD